MNRFSRSFRVMLACVPLLLSAALSSCSGDANRSAGSDNRSMSQRAYNVGIEDANSIMAECHSESAIRARLLDIRAKATNIKYRISEDAAAEYISGFRHGLEQQGDTLAHTLFD